MNSWLPRLFVTTLTATIAITLITMYALMRENSALHAHMGADPSMGNVFAVEADRWASTVSTTTALGLCAGLATIILGACWYLATHWDRTET